MNYQAWIDWSTKQLGDISERMNRQGYTPDFIEYLQANDFEFAANYNTYVDQLNRVMDHMGEKPDGYSHFEAFSKVKMALLKFTNTYRARLFDMQLAQTA